LRFLVGIVLSCVALAFGAGSAQAHNQAYAVIKATFSGDGQYELTMNFHLAALLMGEPQQHLSDESRERWAALSLDDIRSRSNAAEAYLSTAVEVYADGAKIEIGQVSFPDAATLQADGLVREDEARISAPIVIQGRLPAGARLFSVAAPPDFSETLLSLQTQSGGAVAQVLSAGERSHPFALRGDGARAVTIIVPAFLVTLQEYTGLGFQHILPKGVDHILFVLALFLFGPHWRPLAIQVTAFTLAHSVTLALAVFGLVTIPAVIVEPLIAATIVAVAIDNVFSTGLRRWRTVGVFGFGLLHGVGFASVLSALGLPQGEEALALVGFNIGVELGQIAVLAGAFLAVGWFRTRSWFQARLAIPCSLTIGAVGLVWMIERIVGNLPPAG